MYYRIADLVTEIPDIGNMDHRSKEYLCEEETLPQIVIKSEEYRCERWSILNHNDACYMESGLQFYAQLIHYDGILLHASAVEFNGKAYLFSGPSGIGKSTHTKLWQQVFGSAAQVFNDDKPALRHIDGKWYAYGTPWCGKDGINQNRKVPVAGICFLQRGETNIIRILNPLESLRNILSQTRKKRLTENEMDRMLKTVEKLVNEIPIFELKNRPEPEAVYLSYETMRKKAEEMGL